MVIPDISDISEGQKYDFENSKNRIFRASMIDRTFSFMLDYLIISPVVSFLILILFTDEVSIWRDNSFGSDLQPLFFLLATVFITLFVIIQTAFAATWGATPGQYFLKLKIQNESSSNLFFFRILIRQFGFWLSILGLGFPWIAILAHPEQKSFYDKMSETRVVSLKAGQKYFGFESETKYWQSLFATVLVFLGFLFCGLVWQQHKKLSVPNLAFKKLNKEKFFCQELKNIFLSERLQTAIAFNLMGQVADTCLDKEADFVLWKVEDKELRSLAYYAKSLTEDDEDQEQLYLKQACHSENSSTFLGCRIAKAFLNGKLLPFYQSLNQKKIEKNLLVSTLRHELGLSLHQSNDRKANFDQLKSYDAQALVKKYLISEFILRSGEDGVRSRIPASESPGDSASHFVGAPKDKERSYIYQLIQDM